MVKQIIKEALDKNPIGLKEAVEAELLSRLQIALDTKMNESGEVEEAKSGFAGAVNRAEAARQRALKKAAAMVKKGFSHEVAAKNHDVKVDDLKKHMNEDLDESFDLSELTLEELQDFMMSEDFDQLDEISKEKVAKYADRAFRQADSLLKQKNSYLPKSVQKSSDDALKRRQKGIKMSGKRLGMDTMKGIRKDSFD